MIIIVAPFSADTPATAVLERCHQREPAFRTSRRVRLGSLGCASRCSVLVYRWFGSGKSRTISFLKWFSRRFSRPSCMSISSGCQFVNNDQRAIATSSQRRTELTEPGANGRRPGPLGGSTARLTWRLQVSNLVSILVRRKRLPP